MIQKPCAIACLFWLLALPANAQQGQAAVEERSQNLSEQPAAAFAREFVIGIGADYSYFTDAEQVSEEGFTTTGVDLRRAGFDFTVSGEFVFISWLGVGGGYERIRKVTLDQHFDVEGFGGFTAEIRDGFFDPWVVEIYAAPSFPVHAMVRVFGMLGVAYWKAHTENTVVLLFDGVELDSETTSRENDETTGVYGAGIDVWPHPRAGFRIGYKYIKLEDGDEVDEPVHNVRFMAVFKF